MLFSDGKFDEARDLLRSLLEPALVVRVAAQNIDEGTSPFSKLDPVLKFQAPRLMDRLGMISLTEGKIDTAHRYFAGAVEAQRETGGPRDTLAIVLEQLSKGRIEYNRPEEMTYDREEVFRLRLIPEGVQDDSSAMTELSGQIVALNGVEYSHKTQATIRGRAFEVRPSGPQLQTILPDRTSQWTWSVTPTRFGPEQMILLSVEAIVQQNGKDLPPFTLKTFEDRIPIDVRLWDRAMALGSSMGAIYAWIMGCIASLGGIGAWAVARMRRSGSRPAGFRPRR